MCPNLSLPDGLFFGAESDAQNRLGIEAEVVMIIMVAVLIRSYLIPGRYPKTMNDIIVRKRGNQAPLSGFEWFE
jgi:hypothetical protein